MAIQIIERSFDTDDPQVKDVELCVNAPLILSAIEANESNFSRICRNDPVQDVILSRTLSKNFDSGDKVVGIYMGCQTNWEQDKQITTEKRFDEHFKTFMDKLSDFCKKNGTPLQYVLEQCDVPQPYSPPMCISAC